MGVRVDAPAGSGARCKLVLGGDKDGLFGGYAQTNLQGTDGTFAMQESMCRSA